YTLAASLYCSGGIYEMASKMRLEEDPLLNSRERCLRTIELEDTDLIPLNIWIDTPEPLKSLMTYLGVDEVDRLLNYLKVDFRGFLPNFSNLGIGLEGGYEEKTFKDEMGRVLHRNIFGVVSAYSSNGLTNMYIDHPLRDIEVFDHPWPEVREEDFDHVQNERRMYEDYCLIGGTLQAFETACSLFGYDLIFRLMLTREKTIDLVLDKLLSIAYEQAKLLTEAGVDQVYNGDDVGTQTTMMISPKLWRKYLKPRYKRLADIIHRGHSYFHFHSDGSIEQIIPDLVEIGVDVLEPLQPEAMDVIKIKKIMATEWPSKAL
ncbi:MAG: uroporphyrinogen decarboxylase family protein, partial [Thermoproteota archaeon]